MNRTPDEEAIYQLCVQMTGLLAAPEHGLLTWAQARARLAQQLHEKLQEVLYGDGD